MDFNDNILTSDRSRHFVKKSTTLCLGNNNIFPFGEIIGFSLYTMQIVFQDPVHVPCIKCNDI